MTYKYVIVDISVFVLDNKFNKFTDNSFVLSIATSIVFARFRVHCWIKNYLLNSYGYGSDIEILRIGLAPRHPKILLNSEIFLRYRHNIWRCLGSFKMKQMHHPHSICEMNLAAEEHMLSRGNKNQVSLHSKSFMVKVQSTMLPSYITLLSPLSTTVNYKAHCGRSWPNNQIAFLYRVMAVGNIMRLFPTTFRSRTIRRRSSYVNVPVNRYFLIEIDNLFYLLFLTCMNVYLSMYHLTRIIHRHSKKDKMETKKELLYGLHWDRDFLFDIVYKFVTFHACRNRCLFKI